MNVARMLFWGQMGVNRDIEAAVELYRLNAEQNPMNPVAQYDYGVILMRVSSGNTHTHPGSVFTCLPQINQSNVLKQMPHSAAHTLTPAPVINYEF